MKDYISILALCFSALALGVSALALGVNAWLLVVHYRNQVERRHGEISKLRSGLLQNLNNADHHLRTTQMNLEIARLEMRRLPNADYKYDAIEKIPNKIERAQELSLRIKELRSIFEGFNTKNANKSSVLMFFQSAEHDYRVIERTIIDFEESVLDYLKLIRSAKEAGE